MRTYATILCLLLTVPAYAADTLQVTTPDPMTEAWRWTEFDRSSGIVSAVSNLDVRETIEYCVSTVSPLLKEGVSLPPASLDASVGQAHTDDQRVRQMMINLLSNAVKFTGEGSVTVSAVCASS